MADGRITFVPAKNFEAVVYREASGRGAAGASVSSRRRTTNLVEVADFVAERAQQISSERPGMPRDTGGLRRSRVIGNRVVPYLTYDFRRERQGQRQYQTSFTEPAGKQSASGRLVITVFNLSPTAEAIEDGTGGEKVPIDPSGRRVFRIPISQRAYRRMNRPMSLGERRARGLLSGDREYRAASARQQRLLHSDFNKRKQASGGGAGEKKTLRTAQQRRAARAISSNPSVGQIRRQTRGYSKRFVGVNRDGRLAYSQPFAVKRRRYIVNVAGKAYLGTPNASRYDGYGIFRRALQDAAARYL